MAAVSGLSRSGHSKSRGHVVCPHTQSWALWLVILKAAFGLPLIEDERDLLYRVAEREPPGRRVRELWVIAGRRAGKDSVASLIAAWFAAFVDYAKAYLVNMGGDRPQDLLVNSVLAPSL